MNAPPAPGSDRRPWGTGTVLVGDGDDTVRLDDDFGRVDR